MDVETIFDVVVTIRRGAKCLVRTWRWCKLGSHAKKALSMTVGGSGELL